MLLLNNLKTKLQSKSLFISLIIFTLLYVFINVKVIRYESIYKGYETSFVGVIQKIKETKYGYSLTINSKEKLIVYTTKCNYSIGDKVYIEGVLEEPKNNTVLNTFNYKEYLYQNKIYYTVNASNIILVKKNNNIIYKLKDKLVKYMDTFKSKKYLKSFILGETSYLDDDIYKSYQKNGICHLLSIGSFHITILSILILSIFKKIKINETISHLFLFIVIFLYLLLTNFGVPILRVYLYLIFKYLNKKFKLNLSPIKLFILTTITTLFINPFYIYHKGFLYSYSISFILILNRDKLTGNYFQKLIKISLISFIASIPFNIYFNYEINLFSILYNLLFVPAFNLIVFPVSLLTLFLPFLDNLFYSFMTLLNNISFSLNNITIGIIILKKMNFLILIIYLVLIIFIIKDILNKKIRGFIILSLVLLIHFNINVLIPKDFFMIIDVKQGDSSLFYSNNKVVLIDTGGVYQKQVSEDTIEMLKSLGIRKIDYLFLTHGDFDHMGDSIYLVNNFKVNQVFLNANELSNQESKLINELDKKNISYSFFKEQDSLRVNNLNIIELNRIDEDENASSLVLYILFKDKKILMMGDATTSSEDYILDKYNLGQIDYLKVGHHGSNTSSSKRFIETIKPKYSFISVGLNNRYGHPKEEVLETLSNSRIYRTDINGSIEVDTNKNRLITYDVNR